MHYDCTFQDLDLDDFSLSQPAPVKEVFVEDRVIVGERLSQP